MSLSSLISVTMAGWLRITLGNMTSQSWRLKESANRDLDEWIWENEFHHEWPSNYDTAKLFGSDEHLESC